MTAADKRPEATVDPAELDRLDRVAYALDARFAVPGTPWRIGWDGILGLVPGFGDALTGAVGLWLVLEAVRLGAGTLVVLRMLINLALDLVIGSIPLLGDLFDIAFKVNQRNMRILRNACCPGHCIA